MAAVGTHNRKVHAEKIGCIFFKYLIGKPTFLKPFR